MVYRDRAWQWRWRLIARNGRTIAGPGEGFTRRHDAVRSARRAHPMLVIHVRPPARRPLLYRPFQTAGVVD